ncbi:MAG TPA: hypothetical protein PLP61_06100 [Nocardioides sp.]|uniref:hypothetical protein n=1 Tax=Nocardioides sp. TaxID=35761 RepID=UPI002B7D82E8|nr:hypothetical protein [Nocardioides sp.]HQR26596.1 hypothetical protein [Nocardioides sp.]
MNHSPVRTRLWASRLLEHRLVQPDDRSCGASCLVVATALRDETYAELLVTGTHPVTRWWLPGTVEERFAAETLAMHRRITGPVGLSGRAQLPWPRHLGTPPWAVRGQLSTPQVPYVVKQAVVGRRRLFDTMRAPLEAGAPVAVFVGDHWAPRHVLLAIAVEGEEEVLFYDPAPGQLRRFHRSALVSYGAPLGRWHQPWCLVLPKVTPPARRTGA